MTAEIAVLNRSAIALAADSAATLRDTGKSYPANKLFALSRFHPVGVMVYHSDEFMGVPWETLIKMYRAELAPAGKPTISDYADDFLRYINRPDVCTEEQKLAHLQGVAKGLFASVRHHLASQTAETHDAPTVGAVCERFRQHYESRTPVSVLDGVDCVEFVAQHRVPLEGLIGQCFEGVIIDADDHESLLSLLAVAIKSDERSGDHSGIVFAGFGETELFPTLVEVRIDGVIANVVKAKEESKCDIARVGLRAAIVPFAQREMVHRFMEGVDPELLRYVLEVAENGFADLGQTILTRGGTEFSEQQREALMGVVNVLTDALREDVGKFCRDRFVDPILKIVTELPKEEMATLAEALVSLTSLKRRVSDEQESVGGPVDVALISKGDGFVWVKRKHYFDPELNRDYLARIAMHGPSGKGD